MKTALAQINPTVGALKDNARLILNYTRQAAKAGAQLVVFPELALCGYPPEDLILKPHFLRDCRAEAESLAAALPHGITVVFGAPWQDYGMTYNAALTVRDGQITAIYRKNLLPNYGVFDEARVFEAGTEPCIIEVNDTRVGIHICEDSWHADAEPCQALHDKVDLLINLSASPFHCRKIEERRRVLAQTARAVNAPVAYCNMIGGQDELVFDGGSKFISADGAVLARAPQFKEDLLISDTAAPNPEPLPAPESDPFREVYEALKTGLRDYVDKNGFSKVIVALSGGIDSALVVTIAVDALGAERVTGITLPSQYSSKETLGDAYAIANNLGIHIDTVAIKDIFEQTLGELQPLWDDPAPGITEENLQARIRGVLVMAMSNKTGSLVLTTGNKSEMAVGYCTLYGDMCGGFAVIKDVPKTMVFELCRWRNRQSAEAVIPPSTIERPPSAELRPDQKDSDSLPDYAVLDAILECYVEKQEGFDAIVAAGHDPDTVARVIRLVDLNEYKRRQGAPGVKITPRAFGRDRRMPITNRYRG